MIPKSFRKMLSCIIVLAIMVTSLAACGGTSGQAETVSPPSEVVESEVDAVPDTDAASDADQNVPDDRVSVTEASDLKVAEEQAGEVAIEPALSPDTEATETEIDTTVEVTTVVEENDGSDIPPDTDEPSELFIPELPQDVMTSTQRNSINLLNYISFLTQEINEAKDNRLFLETTRTSLYNNTYPNVDVRTQTQLNQLLETLKAYRMVSVKRERINYIYSQNRAQAVRQAIPNPLAILSVVQSGNILKSAFSLLYMTVDTASKYASATSQADMQYLKDGWELEDEERDALDRSRDNAFNYMIDMVRENSLDGDDALSETAIQNFVTWKNNPNNVRRIAWLESNRDLYKAFGPYWLELVRSYYEAGNYEKCLESIGQYNAIYTRIFRKDYEKAAVLPMALLAAKEIYGDSEYVVYADQATAEILKNTDESNWSARYFVAQIYLDLYSITSDQDYLWAAYKITKENVNVLVDAQRIMNTAYLEPIKEAKAEKGATKREKKEIEQYNKLIKAERKVAVPPVSEPLYLNCELLFALAEELDLDTTSRNDIDNILHGGGEQLFLSGALDNRFWFNSAEIIDFDALDVTYEAGEITLPVTCITDRADIKVIVTHVNDRTVFDDWSIDKVDRPKKGGLEDYTVHLKSKKASDYKYNDGDNIVITITPVQENPDITIEFKFKAVAQKKALVFNGLSFERIK